MIIKNLRGMSMRKLHIFSILILAFISVGSLTLQAQNLEYYRGNWNVALPPVEQYDRLKKMNDDGLLPGNPVGKEKVSLQALFTKSEKVCQIPKPKGEQGAYFKTPDGKVCTEALKQAYKETFRQLIMNKS